VRRLLQQTGVTRYEHDGRLSLVVDEHDGTVAVVYDERTLVVVAIADLAGSPDGYFTGPDALERLDPGEFLVATFPGGDWRRLYRGATRQDG
jgi:hypothetical protein